MARTATAAELGRNEMDRRHHRRSPVLAAAGAAPGFMPVRSLGQRLPVGEERTPLPLLVKPANPEA